ncbi:MAG: hypothetical protein ACI81L_000261 [Verrucomicrobiales bacterium]|jgi:hypothetical protein
MRRPLRSDEARAIANIAIDLGDPGRMAKARRVHRSNGVGEVDISGGIAEATVTDADGELHDVQVTIEFPPVNGPIPASSDLRTSCVCDDQGDTCTHALAALLGIAEAVEANGRLLDLWTGSSAPTTPVGPYSSPSDDQQAFFEGAWSASIAIPKLVPIRFDQAPALVVDEVDAGPVVIDAIAAIGSGLRQYRAQQ